MKPLVLLVGLILLGSCSEQKNAVSKEKPAQLSLSDFQNLKEVAFHYYSPSDRKYVNFVVEDPEMIADLTKGFSLEKAEECLCKKSSYASFIKDDGSYVKINFGPHSFHSSDHPGLFKTPTKFWDLFWNKLSRK